jgi:hypothetical protein
MRTRTAGRAIPALVFVAAGLALTACGPTHTSSSPSAGPSSASSSSTGGTGSTGPAAGGPTATSTAAGGTGGSGTSGSTVPACATSRLKTTTQDISSGAGSTTFELVFQNTGTAPCTLRGYPGVSFVKIHNVQLGKAASRSTGAVTTVTLIPNAHAYADVRTVDGQGGYTAAQCDLTTVPTLRVYPPNQTESTNIPWNVKECVGSTVQNLRVGPVHGDR